VTSDSNGIIKISFRIPSVVGCIDDMYIPITAPAENEPEHCMDGRIGRDMCRNH